MTIPNMKTFASKQLLPGKSFRLKYDCSILKRDDIVEIFSVERGLSSPWFACYCIDKDAWEYLMEDSLK